MRFHVCYEPRERRGLATPNKLSWDRFIASSQQSLGKYIREKVPQASACHYMLKLPLKLHRWDFLTQENSIVLFAYMIRTTCSYNILTSLFMHLSCCCIWLLTCMYILTCLKILVYFYNFGWKDYGVASLTTILDMVKVMSFAVQEGKMAIHCHAGLGRTG